MEVTGASVPYVRLPVLGARDITSPPISEHLTWSNEKAKKELGKDL